MKKAIVFLLLVMCLIPAKNSFSQEELSVPASKTNLKGMYMGGVASTNGYGGEVKYIFNKWFTLKSGYETLNLSASFNFDENDISYDANMDYKTGGFFLLSDFNYTKNLYISAGIIFNSFNPEVQGHSVSDLNYGDISIPSSKVGDFAFTFSPSLKASPYIGVGSRSFIGKNDRVMFNFETGLYYMGPPKIGIEATGLLAPTADPAHGQKDKLESQINQYKYYPVIKINLAVRLF